MTNHTTTTSTTDQFRDQARQLVQNLSTADLIEGALAIEGTSGVDPSRAMVRAWMLEEVERRYPSVTPALDAWADSTVEAGAYAMTYTEALVAALPEGVLA